jgi:hypothetical protein
MLSLLILIFIQPVYSIPDWAKVGNYAKYRFTYDGIIMHIQVRTYTNIALSKSIIRCEGFRYINITDVHEHTFVVQSRYELNVSISPYCQTFQTQPTRFYVAYETLFSEPDENQFYVSPKSIDGSELQFNTTYPGASLKIYIKIDKNTGWFIKYTIIREGEFMILLSNPPISVNGNMIFQMELVDSNFIHSSFLDFDLDIYMALILIFVLGALSFAIILLYKKIKSLSIAKVAQA